MLVYSFSKVFGVLADDFSKGSGGGTGRDDGLCPRVVGDGEWLAWSNHIVHRGGHDGAEVSMGGSSTVGRDGSGILFEFVTETCK